jgi:hypothetical protein
MIYYFRLLKFKNQIDGNLNNEIKVFNAYIKFNKAICLEANEHSKCLDFETKKYFEVDYYLVIKYTLEDNYDFKKTDAMFFNFIKIQDVLLEYQEQASLIADALQNLSISINEMKRNYSKENFILIKSKFNN